SFSIGCVFRTTIGARYFVCPGTNVRALAFALIATESIPKSFEKKPGAPRWILTAIVSFGPFVLEIVMSLGASPPPFLSAYDVASDCAFAGLVGRLCAPASAAASAV